MPVKGATVDDLTERLRTLVTESLAHWNTGHRLRPTAGYPLSIDDAGGSCAIAIEPDTGPSPFRWIVTTPEGNHRCMSIIGVLDELRAAVGEPFPEGPPLRIGVVGAS